jgi:hypothetical protein
MLRDPRSKVILRVEEPQNVAAIEKAPASSRATYHV